MARHFECLAQSVKEFANMPPIAVPVTILCGRLNEHPADPHQHAERVSAQANLIMAEESGHWIQLDEPELVVRSVRELVENARRVSAIS
jgi:pimeloyl-ACP methyl ester carboxylesterase